jgi:hypothetical protein
MLKKSNIFIIFNIDLIFIMLNNLIDRIWLNFIAKARES